MVIFNQTPPLPPAEGAFRAEGDGMFVAKTMTGYRQDTVWIPFWIWLMKNFYQLFNWLYHFGYGGYHLFKLLCARELIHMCLTDKEQVLKISRASFNRNNGIHPIQTRKI